MYQVSEEVREVAHHVISALLSTVGYIEIIDQMALCLREDAELALKDGEQEGRVLARENLEEADVLEDIARRMRARSEAASRSA